MENGFRSEWEQPELETLADLAQNIVLRLPGCDDTLVRKTLQEVAREFVSDTQCLTSVQPLAPDAGGLCFPVPRFGGTVADVREVRLFRRVLRRGSEWNWPVGTGIRIARHLIPRPHGPGGGSHGPQDAVRYAPMVNVMDAPPSAPDAPPPPPFTAVVVEHLQPFFENLPKQFLTLHGDAVCSGVMARLCAMTGKRWSDQQVAAEERARYDNAKSAERMRSEAPRDGRAIDTQDIL